MKAKPYLRSIGLKQGFNRDCYPFNIPAICSIEQLDFHEDVTFLVGENGTGKSTLLEAIAVTMGFGREGGTKNVQFETANTISELHNYLKITKSFEKPKDSYFLRAESFYNVATYMDEVNYLVGYGGKCSFSASLDQSGVCQCYCDGHHHRRQQYPHRQYLYFYH